MGPETLSPFAINTTGFRVWDPGTSSGLGSRVWDHGTWKGAWFGLESKSLLVAIPS